MDPFTAATGVAGLISLGIEVCKGLNAYCRDYRSRDSDILTLGQHAKRLEDFLQLIESRMKTNCQVDQFLATTFEDCHATCTMCLQDFAALNTKYARSKAVSGFRKQGKAFIRQLQFPFHKDKFDSLKSQMLEFQNALSRCLLLLNCDVTTEVLHTTVAEAAKISSAIISQGQRMNDQISFLLPQIDRSIDKRLSRLEQLILSRSNSREIQTSDPYVQGQETRSLVDYRLDEQKFYSDDGTFGGVQASKVGSPSGIEAAIQPPSPGRQQLRETRTPLLSPFICSCRNNITRYQSCSSNPSDLNHHEGCPNSFLHKRDRTISGNIRAFSTLFSWKITIRYSQSLLRDLEVRPNLTATKITEESPAFELIDSLDEIRIEMMDKQVERNLLSIIKSLHQLFIDRQAWPTDISLTDQNLLHRACTKFGANWPVTTANHFVQLLKALVSMGVPINGNGHCGTPLRWLLWTRELHRDRQNRGTRTPASSYSKTSSFIAKELLSLDARYSESTYSNLHPPSSHQISWALLGLFPYVGDSLHGFEYGELSSALIRRSEANVRRLLSKSATHVFEKGHHEQTPLHISVCWPRGLMILFELAGDACKSIIDTADSTGLTPLQCAISWHQAEAIVFLLNQNASINLEDTSAYMPRLAYGHIGPQTKEVCEVLAASFAAQRVSMLRCALEKLPESEIVRFNLRNVSILQDNAFEVVRSLQLQDATFSVAYEHMRPGSIYHSDIMDDTLAEALFQAGFNNIDTQWRGYTPLMARNFGDLENAVRLISWFFGKRADFLAVIPVGTCGWPATVPLAETSDFRAVHRLASALGSRTARVSRTAYTCAWSEYRHQFISLMQQFISMCPRDSCQCYCAPEGCDAISSYAKSWAECYFMIFSELQETYIDFQIVLSLVSCQEVDVQIAFTRVCTFQRLGMRHTCCAHQRVEASFYLQPRPLIKILDPTEVNEVQTEDRYLAEFLDELMEDFKHRLEDKAQSFEDFWMWWTKRMDHIEQEKESIPIENIESMIDIGIRLEEF